MQKGKPDQLQGQPCPVCHKKTLMLMEEQRVVPHFGKLFLFSMTCAECKYHLADVETTEKKEPCKFSFDISSEKDLNVKVVKSSKAIVKIPHVTTIIPGSASNGYITNVEGIINRIKHSIEIARDSEEDNAIRKKAKNLLKKLNKVVLGQEKIKLIIEDPSGNSAILSDKAVKTKL
jgi:zinc finger protein